MNKKAIIFSVCVSLLVVLALVVLPSVDHRANAQATDNTLHGYLWSSNIGWISLNSANTGAGDGTSVYNVSIAGDVLNGYAWSPKLGWLRFGTDLTGPEGNDYPYGAKIVTEGEQKSVQGWARFCAAYKDKCTGEEKDINAPELGGWDGWVKMINVVYTPGNSAGIFSGYAWGGLNVGWISFSYPFMNPPDGGDPEVCNGVDDDGDGLVDEGLVCGGPGGGPTVECLVTPDKGNTTTRFTWYIETLNGFSGDPKDYTYTWSGNDPVGPVGTGEWNEVNSRNEAVVDNYPTLDPNPKTGSVTVDDGQGHTASDTCSSGTLDGVTIDDCVNDGQPVPALPLVCCNPDPSDATDDICGPPAPACSFNFSANPARITLTFNPALPHPILLPLTVNLDPPGCLNLSLTATELPTNVTLICSTDGGTTWGAATCSNLTGTSVKVGVSAEPQNIIRGELTGGCKWAKISDGTISISRKVCFAGTFGN